MRPGHVPRLQPRPQPRLQPRLQLQLQPRPQPRRGRMLSLVPVVALLSGMRCVADVAAAAGGGKRAPLVTRVLDGHLCNMGSNAVAWANVWFTLRGAARLANADFELTRPTKTLSRIEFTLNRCSDAISFNTCEYFDTWKFSIGPCGLMKASRMPWSQWVSSIQPPFHCPLKPGNYSFRDAGVDASGLDQFGGLPLENAVWIVTLKLFDQNAHEYMCVNYTGELTRPRTKPGDHWDWDSTTPLSCSLPNCNLFLLYSASY
ncbi:ATP-dependent DNA helicase MPH1, partial [Frankliniella fusca]